MQKCKTRSSRVIKGSRDQILEFLNHMHMLGTVEARNFKFGKLMDREGH